MTKLKTLQLMECGKHGQHVVTACSTEKHSSYVFPEKATFRKLSFQSLEERNGNDEAGQAWRD